MTWLCHLEKLAVLGETLAQARMQVRRIAREGPVCETAGAHGKQQHRPGKQVRMVDDERRRALLTEDGDQPGGCNEIQPYDQYHRRSGRGKTSEEVHGY